MADDTTMVTNFAQPYVVGDKMWRGIDTYNDANKLPSGYAQRISNMQLDGGSLVLRNGWQGLLQPTELNSNPYVVSFTGGGSPNINGTFPTILSVGLPVTFTTTGGLPGEISVGITYYVVGTPTTSSFTISATINGTAINFATAGTGVHRTSIVNGDASGVYEMIALKNSPGIKSNIVYTSAGEIRVFNTTTNTYTTLSTGTEFNSLYSPNVRMVIYGKYVYGVPGLKADGTESSIALFRTDGTTLQTVPTISGFPNLKPSSRAYAFVENAVPATNKNLFIDSAVGPILRTGGATTLVSDYDFTAGAAGAMPTSGAAWLKYSGDPQRKAIPLTVAAGNFPSGVTASIVSPLGIGATRMIEIAGTDDGIYQNIPYIGTTVTFSSGSANVSGTFNPIPVVGTPVAFATTGALPANFAINTTYYVVGTPTSNIITVSATVGGAAITAGIGGSGIHTLQYINVPDEQVNFTNQNNSSTAISCTVAGTVVTSSNHNLKVGQKILFAGTTGLQANTDAWVLTVPSVNTFTVSVASQGGATYTFTASGSNSYFTIQSAGMYLLSLYAINIDTQNSVTGQSIKVALQAYKGGVAIQGAYTSSIVAPPIARSGTDWIKANLLCDFRPFRDQITSFQILIQNVNAKDGDQKGIYVTNVNLHAVSPRLNTDATDAADPITGLVKVKAFQNNTNVSGYAGLLKACAVKFSFATGKDWSKYDSVSMRMQFPEKIRTIAPNLRIGLQQDNAAIEWGGFGTIDEKNGYMTWSVRGFTDSRISAVKQMYIRCETDVQDIVDGEDFFYVGDIVVNGNLSAGIKYTYRFSRWYPEDGVSAPFVPGTGTGTSTVYLKGFESELSGVSNEITTTEALSANQILLNPGGETLTGTGYTHLIIYRSSTAFTDGLYRCLGSLRLSDNTINGPNLTLLSSSGGITLIDNVAESSVLDDGPKGSQGDVYEIGQDNFPTGATAITVHQQRLWIGKNNTLWTSWLFDADNEYTINTTHVPLPTDPKIAIKGASFDVSSKEDKEYIVNMLSYHGDMMTRNNSTTAVLLVFRENAVYPITGFDPSNYSIQAFLREPGIGLLAPRAASNVLGQPWYLNSKGIVQFSGTEVIPKSVALDSLLNITGYRVQTSDNNFITAAQYQKTAMVMHDKKLFLFGPRAYKTATVDYRQNIQVYVWDTRYDGWVSFDCPSVMTDGVSLDTLNDSSMLYAGGHDGQIYILNNYYDSLYTYKPTTASPTNTLNFSGTTNTTGLVNGDIVIVTSSGGGLAAGTSMYVVGVTSSTVQLSTTSGGTAYVYTGGTVPQFCRVGTISWEILTRAYGQNYSDGISYYSKNRPSQLDMHVIGENPGGTQVNWIVQNEATIQSTGSYLFYGEASRAIRGLKRDVIGINFQIGLYGSEVNFPFRLYAVHLHMIESGIQRHR
jgi:hypothetical protein